MLCFWSGLLKSELHLTEFSSRHEFVHRVITSELPSRYKNIEITSIAEQNPGESPRLAADFRCFVLQNHFADPKALGEISPEIMSLLNYLYQLANIYKTWNNTSFASSQLDPNSTRERLTFRWSSIRSSLSSFPSAHASVPHAGINDYTYESIRLAVIILLRKGASAMDPTQVTTNATECLQEDVNRLRAALENTRLFEFWEPLPGALIWCLAIGANVCRNGMLKNWFLVHLSRSMITYSLIRFKQLHECVVTILYGLKQLMVVYE